MPVSWPKVEAVFHEAMALPASERSAYIRTACAGDLDLLREVESLLSHAGKHTAVFEGAVAAVATTVLTGPCPAEHFGPYRIEQKLGEGGMGAVYLATDTRLDRAVALKVIGPLLSRSPQARVRFLREARSAAALAHPNIAAIYDVGESDGTPWLVMEYVQGTSMRSGLPGPLDPVTWHRYATQLASALEHAHARGIVHRDVKPENVLITPAGQVKVIDFGLAKAAHEGLEITEPNAFLGTIAYAAPELLSGGPATARSDVYSLGVVLYEMASGAPPFHGLTGHALISAILAGNPPECDRAEPWMSLVITACMSREPAERFRDGGDLLTALNRAYETKSTARVPEPVAPVLAILDFQNLGGSAELDWLGTGIAETLSADLAKLKTVQIANRLRVAQQLRTSPDPTEAARATGARWSVTGTYQRAGERIRVIATLTDAERGTILSQEKIDGRFADLFDVQDRVVAALLNALTIGFTTTAQQRILPPETRDLAAYEHYVRGRQQMYVMEAKSLTAAIHHFHQAVTLDAGYALAYSGLGTAHALRFIRTSDPEDVSRASSYLERAIELDPELGEPYPWLANIRLRKNDPAGAILARQKAIELQPDLPESHYFYAGTLYMAPEHSPEDVGFAVRLLRETIRLQPRFHPAWVLSGAVLAFLGHHRAALEKLAEAIRLESSPDAIYRFVGARSLAGFAHAHLAEWELARAAHEQAIESLRDESHVYTSCFQALSACGLGEVELRAGTAVGALAHFRHARRIVKEAARIAGSGRLLARINAGLAAAYAGSGQASRASELAAEAEAQIVEAARHTGGVTFECNLPQLHVSMAPARIRMGDVEGAMAKLQRAVETGWHDLPRLLNDPETAQLCNHRDFAAVAAKLRQRQSASANS